MEEYDYPYKNPYKATIIGSSSLLTDGVSKNIPRREYKLKDYIEIEPHETLWYQDGFNFTLVRQKEKAPLIFVIAGTGSSNTAWKMTTLERIFYDAGYSVISVTSPFNANFIITASETKVPGIIYNDSKELYEVMKAAYKKIEKKVDVSEFYLTGYSMGGTESAYVSYIDETEKFFDFKRVLMINPAVNLYESALILDRMLDENIPNGQDGVSDFIDKTMNEIIEHYDGEVVINEDTIYEIFREDLLSDEEMQALIGIAFRFTAIDLNYLTDLLNKMGVYSDESPTKFQRMTPVWEKMNGTNFDDYIEKIAYPHYKEIYNGITFEGILKKVDIHEIDNYLKTSKKLAMVTNEDELILTKENLKYLRETFGDRGLVYPLGGHCGNMFYKVNVKNMIRFFDKGVLANEN